VSGLVERLDTGDVAGVKVKTFDSADRLLAAEYLLNMQKFNAAIR